MRALRVGVPGGMVAGAVMAIWSMAAMWVTGSGFWTPLNLIAHTFYRSAPLNGSFSAPALVIGLAVHMTVASVFGVSIAVLARLLPRTRSLVIAGGILFVAAVWPLMQWVVWYKLDESAAEGFNEWIFAVAHLLFGLSAAAIASVGIADGETARRGQHAAGRTIPQPAPPPGYLFQPNRRRLRPRCPQPAATFSDWHTQRWRLSGAGGHHGRETLLPPHPGGRPPPPARAQGRRQPAFPVFLATATTDHGDDRPG